jgi:CubicO group peptidase (beta-lactamase class C family)
MLAAHRVTGAQIAIVSRGKLVFNEAFGLRRVEPKLPMTVDTPTWAASITKAVFGTYLARLAAAGTFDLDLPVAQQLPKPLDAYDAYRESASELVKDPRWPRITPRMLMAHTGGLRNFAFLEPDQKIHLHFEPGTQFGYSGEGINLVQFVVEQKLGKAVSVLMEDAIFRPLGMTQTSMNYQTRFGDTIADRHGEREQFLAKTRRNPPRAAGSMTTTAGDLARFAMALFDNQFLAKPARRELFKPFVAIRTLHQFPQGPNEPPGEEARRLGLAYGLGWGLLTRTPRGPAFFKEGHGDGAQTYMVCFTKERSCMVLLTNSDNGERAFRALLEKLMAIRDLPWEWEGFPGESGDARKPGMR